MRRRRESKTKLTESASSFSLVTLAQNGHGRPGLADSAALPADAKALHAPVGCQNPDPPCEYHVLRGEPSLDGAREVSRFPSQARAFRLQMSTPRDGPEF
jgi:hypothetical protein